MGSYSTLDNPIISIELAKLTRIFLIYANISSSYSSSVSNISKLFFLSISNICLPLFKFYQTHAKNYYFKIKKKKQSKLFQLRCLQHINKMQIVSYQTKNLKKLLFENEALKFIKV